MIQHIKPEAEDSTIANASRCALRTYARHIKNQYPQEASEIESYVRNLDKSTLDKSKAKAKNAALTKITEISNLILFIVQNSEVPLDISLLKIFLKSQGHGKAIPYVDHCIVKLSKQKSITIKDKKLYSV